MAALGDAWQRHARKLRAVGWSWEEISERLTDFYGFAITAKVLRRVCRDVPKGAVREYPPSEPIHGERCGNLHDKSEGWLARNDPSYLNRARAWISPKIDGLSRSSSGGPQRQLVMHGLAEEAVPGTNERAVRANAHAWGDWSWRERKAGKAAPIQIEGARKPPSRRVS